MIAPNLADSEVEPTEEQLAELCRRAFASVGKAHAVALEALHEQIARDGAEARRQWLARRP
ncbi:MAG: hypothetical protein IPJ34_04615 [Myxococcales bacterium]|nr:hypothetical protein [Myxococcales bacterium]